MKRSVLGLVLLAGACGESSEMSLTAARYTAHFPYVFAEYKQFWVTGWGRQTSITARGRGFVSPTDGRAGTGATVDLSLTIHLPLSNDLEEGTVLALCGEPNGSGTNLRAIVEATTPETPCDAPLIGSLRVLDCPGGFAGEPVFDLAFDLYGPLSVDAIPGDAVAVEGTLLGVEGESEGGWW